MALSIPEDKISVGVLLIGTLGDVGPFLDLFSNLPRFKPTIFTHAEHATLVQTRGFDFVAIFSLESFTEANPQIVEMTGIKFVQSWISHILSEAVLDDVVHTIRSAHNEKNFGAFFTQQSSANSEYFVMGNKMRIPLIRIEIYECIPNLRSHFFINTSMIPSFLMPMFWRLYFWWIGKLVQESGWGAACERHGLRVWGLAESWQRYVRGPYMIGNDFAYANRADFECIVRDVKVTPRWGLEEVVDPIVEENVTTFLEMHNGRVGLVCFGSMEIPDEAIAKLSDFLDECGPVIVQKGSCPVPNKAWFGVAAGKANVLFINEQVPHAWLLPKAAWFVCHGGVGTTQAALRARVPMMIVPFLYDQEAILSELVGRGPRPCGSSSLALFTWQAYQIHNACFPHRPLSSNENLPRLYCRRAHQWSQSPRGSC